MAAAGGWPGPRQYPIRSSIPGDTDDHVDGVSLVGRLFLYINITPLTMISILGIAGKDKNNFLVSVHFLEESH